MGIILAIARLYIPAAIKKQYLQQLFAIVADAFAVGAPQIKSLSFQRGLQQFAAFSKMQAECAIRSNRDLRFIKDRLYEEAHQLGQNIRKQFRIKTQQDVVRAAAMIYRVLGIDFRCDLQGEALYTRCFFSRFYTREVCEVISAIDAGVLAGLSGGARLSFRQRITEGQDCCRAYFDLKEPER